MEETMIDWEIKGNEFANCNCSYGCPCQFNALPTHGFCAAACGYLIESGHFGEVRLDGLRTSALYRWAARDLYRNSKLVRDHVRE